MKRNHTYLTGTLMAVNAIRDSYLLVDGPDCIYKKVETIHKNHDYFSKLLDRDGFHRVSSTISSINDIHRDRTSEIKERLEAISSYKRSGILFVTSIPMTNLLGVQYDNIISSIITKKKIVDIPYRSIDLDWMDSYSDFLYRLSLSIDVEDKRIANNVSVVGHLFDRYEGDNLGNIKEIRSILESLGLTVNSFWLDGTSHCTLKEIEKSCAIISLPYGRKAAETLCKKTNATLINTCLPIGIEGTKKFIKAVAEGLNISEKGESLIENGMKSTMPLLRWIVPTFFQGKSISFSGDRHQVISLIEAFRDIDCDVKDAVIFGRRAGENPECRKTYHEEENITSFDEVDYFLGNSDSKRFYPGKVIEFGFPCFKRHYLSYNPYMGFRGFAMLLNRILNER